MTLLRESPPYIVVIRNYIIYSNIVLPPNTDTEYTIDYNMYNFLFFLLKSYIIYGRIPPPLQKMFWDHHFKLVTWLNVRSTECTNLFTRF